VDQNKLSNQWPSQHTSEAQQHFFNLNFDDFQLTAIAAGVQNFLCGRLYQGLFAHPISLPFLYFAGPRLAALAA
jgi:hypothetical protein